MHKKENDKWFESGERQQPDLPTVDVRVSNDYGSVHIQFDIQEHEWSPWMERFDFQMLERAIKADPAWKSFVGCVMDGRTNYELKATAIARMQWLVMMKFVCKMDGQWVFDGRRYCEREGVSYETSNEEGDE